MKGKDKFWLPVLFLLLAVSVSPQNKPTAVKFDEFSNSPDNLYYPFEEITLSKRVERFIKQIKKERSVKIYIIYYQPRILYKNLQYQIRYWADYTSNEIGFRTKIPREDIFVINGGRREKPTIEYWISPNNAEAPNPTPAFTESESFTCPKIYIAEDRLKFNETRSIDFSVPTYDVNQTDDGSTDLREISYEWKVSAGEIVEGGGTRRIKVKINDPDIKRITAFVKVKGLSFPCETGALLTLEIGGEPYLFDRAERYNFSDLAARLDSFMVTLMENPAVQGCIIVYADRSFGTRDMERAIKSVRNQFVYRRFDLSRVTIVRGGFRENGTVDSWILPGGAKPPIPTPTVDKKFVAPPIKSNRKTVRRR